MQGHQKKGENRTSLNPPKVDYPRSYGIEAFFPIESYKLKQDQLFSRSCFKKIETILKLFSTS
jgi:hypothetical protein